MMDVIAYTLGKVLGGLLVGALVWVTWNATLPELFGAPALSFLQATGLTILVMVVAGIIRQR